MSFYILFEKKKSNYPQILRKTHIATINYRCNPINYWQKNFIMLMCQKNIWIAKIILYQIY